MDLQTFRKSRGLSQEDCAKALGLRSKSYISEIEGGSRRASLKLALKIEAWSAGVVRAADLTPEAAEIAQQQAATQPGVSA